MKTPVSLVTVWVVESLLVHVTVVPALTLKVCGEKAKLVNVTRFPDAVGAEVFCVAEPVHAARKASELIVTIKNTHAIVVYHTSSLYLYRGSALSRPPILK